MGHFAPYDPDGRSDHPAFDSDVRRATIDDAPAVARLIAERQDTSFEETLRRTTRELEDTAAEPDRYLVLVAEEEGEIVGFARARWEPAGRGNPSAPEGWYLMGIIVAPAHYRRGVGRVLTQERLDWIAGKADKAYYFVNKANQTSIALHDAFGFVERRRDFGYTRAKLPAEDGILYEVDLSA